MTTAEIPTVNAPGPSRRPTALVARSLGITQGQASTMVLALGMAAVLTLGGLPPVLRNRGAEGATPAASQAPAEAPAAEPTGGDAPAPAVDQPVASDPSFAAPASPTFDSAEPTTFESDFGGSASERTAPAAGEAEVFASVAGAGAPHGIAVGDDTVYVAAGAEVLTYTEGGSAGRRFTVPGKDVSLTGLALDGKGGLVALDATSGRIQRIDLSNGRQRTFATLVDLPACQLLVAAVNGCEPGVEDEKPLPKAAAFDGAGNLYVADAAQGAIWRVPAGGGQPALFTSDAAYGSGDGLAGIAFRDGGLIVASPQALDAESAAGGAVYRIAVTREGKAGERTLVARFLPNERPAGLAVLPDGSMVVALRDAGAVVLLDPEGAEVLRVEGPAGETPLEAPTGIALQGETVLVTTQAADKANWAVLAVGVR